MRFTSNGQQTPILEDLNISLQSDVPNQVGINIGVEGMTGYTAGKEWTSPGTLLGTETLQGSKFVDAFNDMIRHKFKHIYSCSCSSESRE